jgi:hypothetical protein
MGVATAAYISYVIYVGGDYMAMFRFFVPVLGPLFLLVGTAPALLLGDALPSARRRSAGAALLGLALAGMFVQSTPVEGALFPASEIHHGTYRGIQTERWHVSRLELLGRFFGERSSSTGESIATSGIGAVAYYSGMKVYDFLGIVDPEIAHREVDPAEIGKGMAGHEKRDEPLVLRRRRPTYFVFSRWLTAKPYQHPPFAPAVRRELERSYKLVSVLIEDTANGESGYLTFAERVGE